MFANLLIGLREGLEASVVIGILVAYLVKLERRDRLRQVWLGVALAIAMSITFWAVITFTSRNMTFEEQEIFGGTLSIIAVGFVTWMVLWMRKAARGLKRELQNKMGQALALGPAAVVVTAFLAVGREGLETALFLWAAIQAAGNGWEPLTGATIGLALAVALGYLLYRGALRIHLGKFFTWTGAALIVVAGGVLAYGVHDLQEARVLPGLNSLAFDVSHIISPASWHGTLLKGIFNFSPQTTWFEAAAWVAYVTIMMIVFFRPDRTPPAPQPSGPDSTSNEITNKISIPTTPKEHATLRTTASTHVRNSLPRLPKKSTAFAIACVVAAPTLASCSKDVESTANVESAVTVNASDSACKLGSTTLTEGLNTFDITNEGSKVTEVYVYEGQRIVTEKENIGPGTKYELLVDLKPGSYDIACKPGMVGDGIRTAVTVKSGTANALSPEATAAVSTYRAWVQQQADTLPIQATELRNAIAAGDREKAKALYAPSRIAWERIEPVAESFGEIDPRVDAREASLEPGQDFTGWHRIEKALWTGEDLKPMVAIADVLVKDLKDLASRIPSAAMTPTSIGNGAKELLDEVATGKVTGEEEAFSHTDLVDFNANIEGAKKAYEVLRPLVQANKPDLVTTLDQRFAEMEKALAPYKRGTGWVSYGTVTEQQRKSLMEFVNGLSEPLSKLATATAPKKSN